jgi:hypothetical protein
MYGLFTFNVFIQGTFVPGFGCDVSRADNIANELKSRMKGRGDTMQMQLSEKAVVKATEINRKLDIIMNHLATAPMTLDIERCGADAVVAD